MKTFIYRVNGQLFVDTVPFGKAWKTAYALAELTKAEIWRTVTAPYGASEQFFARGVFLDEKFYEPSKAWQWKQGAMIWMISAENFG